jgi:alpha-maltose-1-phosphate synthase
MTPNTNAAIYYAPEAFETAGRKLMGRNVAGETFLRAFAREAKVDAFYCYADSRQNFEHFQANVKAARDGDSRFVWIPPASLSHLGRIGCLFYPSPGIGKVAWQRRRFDAREFSICGMTYTISTNRVMDAVGDLLIAPVQPWDALICISECVRRTLATVLDEWSAYLKARTGAAPSLPLQMPVIPLGVDCDQLAGMRADPALRTRYRQEFGIDEDEVAVLFLGRLSFHAKANPVPMYIGLEAAQRRTGKKVRLLLAGRFANQSIANAFRAGAAALCPNVRLSVIDGTRRDCKEAAFGAADIFTSLSDNIQESFGLAPLEAMAAGLPVVVSDWNGYREIVRHGIDGIAVPTTMPSAEAGAELALRYELGADSYDRYIGNVSMSTAVDIAACTEAYVALIGDPALARAMGEAGRRHARDRFHWPVIIRAYQALWAELGHRRAREAEISPPLRARNRNPLRPDPFAAFAGYPTRSLDSSLVVMRSEGGPDLEVMRKLDLANFFLQAEASEGLCLAILQRLSDRSPLSVESILAPIGSGAEKAAAERALAWLLKTGQVRLVDKSAEDAGSSGGTR